MLSEAAHEYLGVMMVFYYGRHTAFIVALKAHLS